MGTHSSILGWDIPWTEEPGRLQSRGCKESDITEWLTLTQYHLTVLKLRILPTFDCSKVRFQEVSVTKKTKKIQYTVSLNLNLIFLSLGRKESADDNKRVAQTGNCQSKDYTSCLIVTTLFHWERFPWENNYFKECIELFRETFGSVGGRVSSF